ncbi:MAG TPA: sialidase family protein [Candidatus Limnocylindria bacterium]|jgi:predicted neuraminidase|nr:sialidase family protein [Candidatus Limnocylindria bacterium]
MNSIRSLLRLLGVFAAVPLLAAPSAALLKSEFFADPPPTLSSHASTICEGKNGLVAAWFGGTAERERDVVIWLTRQLGDGWSKPVEVARGTEDGDEQWACWNPVLFQPSNGPLMLFYKVGPSPSDWWGRLKFSDDGGRTWSESRRLPNGYIGPVRNKPVELPRGVILCGASEENAGWRVHMETVQLSAHTHTDWWRTADLNSAMDFGAIQPTILPWGDGRLQILCRTRQHVITESWSGDGGRTWSRMKKTDLPNPNSAIDAVMLKEGKALLVYNPVTDSRHTLAVALSDDGVHWGQKLTLEDDTGEYSYPAVIQSGDGLVHVTYTWRREKIKHAVIDPWKLK